MDKKAGTLRKNKALAALFLALGIFAAALIVMRVCFYRFEYDPKYYPTDYGRFNFFSYFTVQSNLYVCFYLICLGLAFLGKKKAEGIVMNSMVRLTVTTYILVTGAVYCGGIPMGMTPPLYWNEFHPILLSIVQIVHHMIMPPLMLILFIALPKSERIQAKKLPLTGIYPLVYSLFSIVRGAVSDPQFYPYPFYRPEFFWQIFCKNRGMTLPAAYLLMLPMLILGIGVFVLLAFALSLIYNQMYDKSK